MNIKPIDSKPIDSFPGISFALSKPVQTFWQHPFKWYSLTTGAICALEGRINPLYPFGLNTVITTLFWTYYLLSQTVPGAEVGAHLGDPRAMSQLAARCASHPSTFHIGAQWLNLSAELGNNTGYYDFAKVLLKRQESLTTEERQFFIHCISLGFYYDPSRKFYTLYKQYIHPVKEMATKVQANEHRNKRLFAAFISAKTQDEHAVIYYLTNSYCPYAKHQLDEVRTYKGKRWGSSDDSAVNPLIPNHMNMGKMLYRKG